MNADDLLELALRSRPSVFDIDGDYATVAFRVNGQALRDIDGCAVFLGVSRATFLRSLLAGPLSDMLQKCRDAGVNSSGRTLDACRPRLLTPGEEEEYRAQGLIE